MVECEACAEQCYECYSVVNTLASRLKTGRGAKLLPLRIKWSPGLCQHALGTGGGIWAYQMRRDTPCSELHNHILARPSQRGNSFHKYLLAIRERQYGYFFLTRLP